MLPPVKQILFPLLLLLFHTTMIHGSIIVSGYNNNMSLYSLTPNNSLVIERGWPVDLNMSWVQVQDPGCTFCNDMIYAIHEVDKFQGVEGGAVSRWRMGEKGPVRLEWISVGRGPAHLLVDTKQAMAYSANYGDGSWTAIGLVWIGNGWRLNNTEQVEKFGAGCRDKSHPHQTVTLGSFVWVVDLGCDTIYHFNKTGQKLTRMNDTKVGTGRGPRHMVIHQDRNLAFLVCEVQNFIQVHRLNNKTGELIMKQEMELSSVSTNFGAEIVIHKNKKWIYVSSRGVGMVIFFTLEDDNTLKKVQEFKIAGTWPRHMALHPDDKIIVVADQMGDHLQVLHVDPQDGTLTGGDVAKTHHQPSFVTFYDHFFTKTEK